MNNTEITPFVKFCLRDVVWYQAQCRVYLDEYEVEEPYKFPAIQEDNNTFLINRFLRRG